MDSRVGSRVEVLVLGPLDVRVDGTEVDVVGAMPRRLLGLLAARVGSVVTADALVDELWQGRPPAGAAATLQSHVARLRRGLGVPDAIRTRSGGYRLEAVVDAEVFESAVHDGHVDEPALRADRLREALGAWRGPAYDGLRDAAALALEGQRLDELRLTTAIECVSLEQSLGRTTGHVQELEDFVRRHPVSEPLWALLMRALYVDARQADALAAYQRARVALRDELGVEPGDALRQIEHRVLTQDPALLPRAPTAREDSGHRRTVTVLALDVTEPTTDDGDPETAPAVARRLALARVIEEHGGTLLRSPGLTAFAVFGSPVAHDDDAARAVRVAEALLERWPGGRAGLATGVVVADPSGEPRPGAVTQRAERLARTAGRGHSRMDGSTRTAALAAGQPGVDVPFVGRSGDLATLRHLLATTQHDGGPHLVTVVAEAGMGKSRLCAELLSGEELTRCLVRRAVVPAYGESAGLRVVGTLLGHDPGSPEGLGPRHDAYERWTAELRREAGDRPLVVFVDDLHWADDLVTGLLHHLVTDVDAGPLFVLVAARPEVHRRHPAWGQGAAAATTLRLGPLTEDEVATLVGAAGVSLDETAARIVERAGGVPLHAVELTRLAETGGSAESATSLAGVLSARLDTLSPTARATAVDASVIGKRFSVSALVAVAERPRAEVQADLRELVDREFVRRIPGGRTPDDREHVFSHDLVRTAAYDRLLRLDAARRHLAAARWGRTRREDDPEFVAHHALRAHDLADAVGDAETAAAARPLARASAFSAGVAALGLDTTTALRLLERAVELADPGSHDLARARCLLGQALFDNGRFGEARTALRAGLEGLEGVSDPLRLQTSMWEMWNHFALGLDLAEPAAELDRLIDELPASIDTVVALGALASLHLIHQTPDELRAAIRKADEAVALAVRLGHPERSAVARSVRGRARLGLGDADGMREMDEAQADLERYEMGTFTIAFQIWRAGAEHHWSGPEAELGARRRLSVLAQQRGLSYMTSFSVAEEVRCLAELGRLREAIELAGTVNADDEAQPRWAVVARALALADLGELDAGAVARVAVTPPASPDDLRHLLGSVLVAGTWAPTDVPNLVAGLGDLTAYAERDGAVELLSRLVRMALDAGAEDLVSGLPDVTGATPLSKALGPHVRGLLTHDAALLGLAAERWRAMGQAVEAALALLDLAELEPDRGPDAVRALESLGLTPWAERARRA